ncbi:MAG: aminoacetone oxidase family FAD-binding enzyme [Ruminococcaceae bacterium]|nr:aminoacetone oxidase family FAD-binding enzyme [Oscillospiraceae bacterium]
MKKRCDLIIIGGGAAGLACAVEASKTFGGSIILLDRKPKVGKKLLVTGNGRCNLSNRIMSEEFYHGSFDVKPLLEEFPDLRLFFEKLGLYTVSDSAGRIYPLPNTASSVLDALRFAIEKKDNVQILTDGHCNDLQKTKDGFTVKAGEHEIRGKAVVLACGGCAAPVHGSDGSGFELAKELGISVNKPYPALCSLLTDGTKSLDGVRCKCAASLYRKGLLEKSELGEVQFTKNGLSGICIFNLSAAFPEGEKDVKVSLDLLPDYTQNDVYNMLWNVCRTRKRDLAEEIFNGIFNRKIALYLLKKADIPTSAISAKMDIFDIKKLAALSKKLEFEIKGRGDFSSAQVTAGGVIGSEIDSNFMSVKHKGLFFAGEIIDLWGDCGGYNLHFAFSSGIKAGRSAVKLLSEKEQR